MTPAIDAFLAAANRLADQVSYREVIPHDRRLNLPLAKFLADWISHSSEPEYVIHAFGYYQGANQIHKESGNPELQLQALERLLQLVRTHSRILRPQAYQLARHRAAFFFLKAQRERELDAKGEWLHKAAREFRAASQGSWPDGRRAKAISLFLESEASKYDAFALINRRPPRIRESLEKMTEAVDLARSARDLDSWAPATRHLAYLQYWQTVFTIRDRLLARDYEAAHSALAIAGQFAATCGESIFPNYFLSSEELRWFGSFIRATGHFRLFVTLSAQV